MAVGQNPVLETLAEMNAASIARSELDPAVLVAVRLAALAASQAPTASYLMHVGPAVDSGVSLDNVQDILVAVAPIIGSPSVIVAARNIMDALGLAIDIAVDELVMEADEG